MAASDFTDPAPKKNSGGRSRPKSSTVVTLAALGVVSVMVVGFCSAQRDEVSADCVDLDDRLSDGSYAVVDDDYCDDDRHYHGSYGAYGWYYGGRLSGTRILGGTTVRPPDTRIVSRDGTVIQRGGFGGRGGGGG